MHALGSLKVGSDIGKCSSPWSAVLPLGGIPVVIPASGLLPLLMLELVVGVCIAAAAIKGGDFKLPALACFFRSLMRGLAGILASIVELVPVLGVSKAEAARAATVGRISDIFSLSEGAVRFPSSTPSRPACGDACKCGGGDEMG